MPPSINYDSPGELSSFLKYHGLGMRKKFGQNFLINSALRSRLIDALEIGEGDEVWEIGPGLGAMTKSLLERGCRLTAFEIDPAFSKILKEFFTQESFRLIEGDVFKTWPIVSAEMYGNAQNRALHLFGNLPYNIAAALLADFIEKKMLFKRMVVTVQREVALRMIAAPGSADYSSFSVLCSSLYRVKILMPIKNSNFFPVPGVDSRGVRLDLLTTPVNLPLLFFPLVRSVFSSRRKTLKNTLTNFASSVILKKDGVSSPAPAETAAEVINRTGISGDLRAETLETAGFTALAAALEAILKNE